VYSTFGVRVDYNVHMYLTFTRQFSSIHNAVNGRFVFRGDYSGRCSARDRGRARSAQRAARGDVARCPPVDALSARTDDV